MGNQYVSYLRVSTARQGRSGLGLEAQRKAVLDFVNGGGVGLLAEYVEVESGKKDDRPELQKALHHCEITGATLVIAKLDRLSRDAHFLLGLQKKGVPFRAVDMPEANEAIVGIMAVIAQQERELISRRTKEALAAAKKRGVKLGNPNGAAHLKGRGNAEAVQAVKSKASTWAERIRPDVEKIIAEGVTSLRELADEMNSRAIKTARGGKWYASSVSRLLERLKVVVKNHNEQRTSSM